MSDIPEGVISKAPEAPVSPEIEEEMNDEYIEKTIQNYSRLLTPTEIEQRRTEVQRRIEMRIKQTTDERKVPSPDKGDAPKKVEGKIIKAADVILAHEEAVKSLFSRLKGGKAVITFGSVGSSTDQPANPSNTDVDMCFIASKESAKELVDKIKANGGTLDGWSNSNSVKSFYPDECFCFTRMDENTGLPTEVWVWPEEKLFDALENGENVTTIDAHGKEINARNIALRIMFGQVLIKNDSPLLQKLRNTAILSILPENLRDQIKAELEKEAESQETENVAEAEDIRPPLENATALDGDLQPDEDLPPAPAISPPETAILPFEKNMVLIKRPGEFDDRDEYLKRIAAHQKELDKKELRIDQVLLERINQLAKDEHYTSVINLLLTINRDYSRFRTILQNKIRENLSTQS